MSVGYWFGPYIRRSLSDVEWEKVRAHVRAGNNLRSAVELLYPPNREGSPDHCALCKGRFWERLAVEESSVFTLLSEPEKP